VSARTGKVLFTQIFGGMSSMPNVIKNRA